MGRPTQNARMGIQPCGTCQERYHGSEMWIAHHHQRRGHDEQEQHARAPTSTTHAQRRASRIQPRRLPTARSEMLIRQKKSHNGPPNAGSKSLIRAQPKHDLDTMCSRRNGDKWDDQPKINSMEFRRTSHRQQMQTADMVVE